MLRISELRLPLDHPDDALPAAIAQRLGVKTIDLVSFTVFKRSYDARKNQSLSFIYIVDADVRNEAALLKKFSGDLHIKPTPDMDYKFVGQAPAGFRNRPVVIGFGPCGIFAALVLAQMGFRPIVLERGEWELTVTPNLVCYRCYIEKNGDKEKTKRYLLKKLAISALFLVARIR